MSLDNKSRFGALAMLAKSLNLETLYKKRRQQVIYYDIYTPDASDTEDEEQILCGENLNETPSSNKSSKKKRETDEQMASTTNAMRQIKRRRLSYTLEDEK